MRKFEATIADLDGQEHSYHFIADTPWDVAHHIAMRMHHESDFYGHKRADTTELTIVELFDEAELINPIEI